jgi:hypothetical protein
MSPLDRVDVFDKISRELTLVVWVAIMMQRNR